MRYHFSSPLAYIVTTVTSSVKKHKNYELCIMHYELFCIFAHGQSPKMDI